MNKSSTLLGLVSVVAIFGSVACGTNPAPAPSSTSADSTATKGVTVANSHSLRSPASDATKSALGISSWHLLMETGSSSVVVEGVDAKGAVKFSTTMQHDATKGVLNINSYKKAPGKFSVTQSGTVKNTIALATWTKYATAFSADWAKGNAKVEYGFKSILTAGKAIVSGVGTVSNMLGAGQAATELYNYGKSVLSGSSSSSGSGSSSNGSSNSNSGSQGSSNGSSDSNGSSSNSNSGSNSDSSNASNDDGSSSSSDDGSSADGQESDGSESSSDDGMDSDDGAQDDGDVSADDGDDNLDSAEGDDGNGDDDDAEGDDGDNGGEDGAEGDDGSGDDDSGGGGDDDGASGDDSGGGGGDDDSGGDEFALHSKCSHLSCSATTKVCVCTKY